MAGLGVFQMFNKAGGDTSGYIPLAGTLPIKPVTGAIKFEDGVKIESQTQPFSFFQIKNTEGYSQMVFEAFEEMLFISGVDGFGQIHMKTADSASNLYIQSGTGGIFGSSINQVLFTVNNGAAGLASLTMNPGFFQLSISHPSFASASISSTGSISIQAEGGLLFTGGSDSTGISIAFNDSSSFLAFNPGGIIQSRANKYNITGLGELDFTLFKIEPDYFYVNTDDGAGKVQNFTIGAGAFTLYQDYPSTASNSFELTENGFYYTSIDADFNTNSLNLQTGFFGVTVADATGSSQMQVFADGLRIVDGTLHLETGSSSSPMGKVVLVAGSAVVSASIVSADSEIFLTTQIPGGAPGWLRVSSRIDATSFTITSSSATDTSTVGWMIIQKA